MLFTHRIRTALGLLHSVRRSCDSTEKCLDVREQKEGHGEEQAFDILGVGVLGRGDIRATRVQIDIAIETLEQAIRTSHIEKEHQNNQQGGMRL